MNQSNILPKSTNIEDVDLRAKRDSVLGPARIRPNLTALEEIMAGLVHDFRNILATIDAGISVAERNSDNLSKMKAALAAAHEGVRRGSRLSSQFLLFTHPEDQDDHPEDINDLIEDLYTFLKYGAGAKIRVTLHLAPDLPKCLIDPVRFNAAILNLVINARDAMPDGGEIRIETQECQQAGQGAATPPLRYVRLSITDQGCGMTSEVASHVFDPYFTTKGEAGTGLGVPQVAAFMRSSGGTVRVSTEPGIGTSFDLLFPLSGVERKVRGWSRR